MTQKGHGDHHKQGCRNAFSGYIRNDQPQMIVVDQKEVIEISADFLGRCHGCKNVKFFSVRERRKLFGKRAFLNTHCQ